jgi:aspartate/methionine/tyrosine aminotransferase
MLDDDTFEALCTLMARHDAFVISDEIYEYLNFSGMSHLSFGARPELSGRVITINGFSKAYSMTGWRIGYLHSTNAAVMKRISQLQQHMNTNTAAFIQQAALAAMDLPRTYLNSYNANLAQNQQALEETAGRSNQLRVLPAQGGLFGFMDISATGMTSDGFATQLLEDHAVALTPGIVFGRNWEGFVRVSLAIEHRRFSEGMARLKKFVAVA